MGGREVWVLTTGPARACTGDPGQLGSAVCFSALFVVVLKAESNDAC